MTTAMQVRPLGVIPDPDDPQARLDRLGNFDYSNGFYIQLFTRTPGAKIFYTLTQDGQAPGMFLPYDETVGVPVPRPAIPDAERLIVRWTLKAYAACPGMSNSELLEKHYTITRKPYRETQVMPLMDSMGLTVSNAWQLRDYDNDNMFLYNGEKAALLFDTGFWAKGANLYGLVRKLAGEQKPLYVVHSHNGPDHIQMTWQFVDQPNTQIFINDRDRYMLEKHIREQRHLEDTPETHAWLDQFIHSVQDGDRFDLGGRVFTAYEVPGHTFGHSALLDQENGDLLAGDCIGTTTVLSPSSLWMWNIVPRVPINDFQSILWIFTERLRKFPVRNVYTGHHIRPLDGQHLYTYLDNLLLCAEKLVDYGLAQTEIGRPFPPFAYVARAFEGRELTNPYSAGIVTSTDLMFEPEYLNGGEAKNDELCYLDVRFSPDGENQLLAQASGLGISLNFNYNSVIPSPDETLECSRTRIEAPVYHISVPTGTEQVYVMPVTGSHFSHVTIEGVAAASTYLHPVKVEGLKDHTIHLQVTSEDGEHHRAYAIQLNEQ